MKILIIGSGIIGTIYGWALSEAGLDVTHYIRPGKNSTMNHTAPIDILDERKGFEKYNKTEYKFRTIDKFADDTYYDLIIVPVNWYQIKSVLEEIYPHCRNSSYYILTSNWTGTDIFDKTIGANSYILGYADAGGTVRSGIYWTNIGPAIHIAAPNTGNKEVFNIVETIFHKAQISLDIHDNMLHWLWAHNAGSLPVALAFQKHKDMDKFLQDKQLVKTAFLAARECVKLCESRGISTKKYPEINFYKMPLWLLIPLFKFNVRHNESMQRYTAHGGNMPLKDIFINYGDIKATAESLNFSMPNFDRLQTLFQ